MALHPRAKEAAGAVVYEMKMFDWLVDRIEAEWAAAAQETRNLLLEGLLLHARTLRDFFLNARRRDDVVAADYFDDAAAWDRGGLCRYTVRHRRRISKKLAHLTYARLDLDEDWEMPAVRDDIRDAWARFLKALPADRRAWFERAWAAVGAP